MKYVSDSKPLPQKQIQTVLFDKVGAETSKLQSKGNKNNRTISRS